MIDLQPIYKVLGAMADQMLVGMDLVLIVDYGCYSEDYLNFAQVVSSSGELLSSIECLAFDER